MNKLTRQQEHLLHRLPNWYEAKGEPTKEPVAVQRARKTVEAYENKVAAEQKALKKSFEADLTKAREAVYFLPAEKALTVVQRFEATWSK